MGFIQDLELLPKCRVSFYCGPNLELGKVSEKALKASEKGDFGMLLPPVP